jgi:hypothetical protein
MAAIPRAVIVRQLLIQLGALATRTIRAVARLHRMQAFFLQRALVAAVSFGALSAAPGPTIPFQLGFFSGNSEGDGTLKLPFSHEQVHVRSSGHLAHDGTLILDQAVAAGTKAVRQRQWRIREVAPGRYSGTLSDAASPVVGERIGDRLRLRFRMKGGLAAEQWLAVAPDGQTARNRMTVRKFGIVVARLDETIRRTSTP